MTRDRDSPTSSCEDRPESPSTPEESDSQPGANYRGPTMQQLEDIQKHMISIESKMDLIIERLDKLSVNAEPQQKSDNSHGRTPFYYDPDDPDEVYVSMHEHLHWYKPRGDNWAEWSLWFSANKLLLKRLPVGSEPYKICWKLLVGFMPEKLTSGRPTSGTIAEQANSLDRYLLAYEERKEQFEVTRYEVTEEALEWRNEMKLIKAHIRDLFYMYAVHNKKELARRLKKLFQKAIIVNYLDVSVMLSHAADSLTKLGKDNPFSVYRYIIARLEEYESYVRDE
ncbi:hypothetical protein DIURU_003239 [Diutina rugosa]|uniref:Uncharacterized protein n=1 Tax=Diutina rugosa TaxID=5481 RepID=A0A642UM47_DIURU|nr:uncharacterized protein DIURU_003239 [Diutina rugosa]KAA8901530.1 hypothetical protein DIURU_003239 [Diutina rugosa]